MISINQAAAQGIDKVRKKDWPYPADHVKIDIVDGQAGPWLHIYSPVNIVFGDPNPRHVLGPMFGSYDDECFVPYADPECPKTP